MQAVFARVFPEATGFGALEGTPPAAAAYRDGTRIGYVFLTRQVVDSAGFSGKPLNIAVGIDMDGRITGAVLVEHHEPILIIGVAEEDLAAFVAQYRGRDVRRPIVVVRGAGRDNEAADTVDAVSGATISSVVMNDAILRAARAVARSRGLLGKTRIDLESFALADWTTLMVEGSLAHRTVTVGALEAALAEQGARYFPPGVDPPPAQAPFLDLYFALATPARIGRNLLGERLYNRILASLNEGDHLIFVAARGIYSFKGTGYVRSGRFDRIQLVQGMRTVGFSRSDHIRVEKLAVTGAPELREMAIFIVRRETGFDPAAPWRLEILVAGERVTTDQAPSTPPARAVFSFPYELPARYRRVDGDAGAARADTAERDGGALWRQVWRLRAGEIAVLAVALTVLTAILIFQDTLAHRRRLHFWLRIGFLSFVLIWLGWYAGAQLSVLHVLTFAEAIRTEFRWSFFLLDPLLFILWSFVAVAMLFWGRGVFCGWLCPFGALQELSNRLAVWARVPQIRLPFVLHERLWPIKYMIFLALFALSLSEMPLAQLGAEVEPFKTAIVLKFDRAWPFVIYPLVLLGIGLFIQRAFCRYLCPLGGALAIPARLRMFEWLKRRWHCGMQCHICAAGCPVQAIHPDGHI
ncbi:MAG: regulatory protein NosR, partial [Alphaproteobacteria bacterium]